MLVNQNLQTMEMHVAKRIASSIVLRNAYSFDTPLMPVHVQQITFIGGIHTKICVYIHIISFTKS